MCVLDGLDTLLVERPRRQAIRLGGKKHGTT